MKERLLVTIVFAALGIVWLCARLETKALQPQTWLVTGQQHRLPSFPGAAGFIGSHLCIQLLQRGHRVVGIDNFDPYYSVQLKRDRVENVRVAAGDSDRFVFYDHGMRALPST